MPAQTYGRHIDEYVQKQPDNIVISNARVAAALATDHGLDLTRAKKIVNMKMKRLADTGKLERIKKGLYGKVHDTVFGKVGLITANVYTGLLMQDNGITTGYFAGPTLLNAIGLNNHLPRERHIATNHWRWQVPVEANIRIYKPPEAINEKNAPYLQAIEMIAAARKYGTTESDPATAMRKIMQGYQLNRDMLVSYAHKHCTKVMFLAVIEIAYGGGEHEAA